VSKKKFRPDVDAKEWTGAERPYDIIKEGTIVFIVVAILTVVLAVVFGSPDVPAITIKKWANAAPADFAMDALSQLNGTSETSGYGPPYNDAAPGQQLGPLHLVKWVGVRIPINPVRDFVIDPLKSAPQQPALSSALSAWSAASATKQTTWVANYTKAATNLKVVNGSIVVAAANDGPVPVMMQSLLAMGRSGALDEALGNERGFYSTNYTLPLLFLEDGTYLANQAQNQHLLGPQWGMMNETGNYPGQAWLWLYTFWYQVSPMNSSSNGDIEVWGIMMLLTIGLILVPFIPGVRTIPRKTRIYRIIWREHYRSLSP